MRSNENGGALATALFALFVTVTVGLLILYSASFIRKAHIDQQQHIIHNINFRNNLTLLKSELSKGTSEIEFGVKKTNKLNDQLVETTLHPFGLFVSFRLKIFSSNKVYDHYGIVVNSKPPIGDNKAALVQLGKDRSFVMAGKSDISGDIYVSKREVKAGTYKGIPYKGEIPKDGKILALKKQPDFNTEIIKATIRECKGHLDNPEVFSIKSQNKKLALEGNSVYLSDLLEYNIEKVSGPGYLEWDITLPPDFKFKLTDFIQVISENDIILNEYSQSSYCLFYSSGKIEIKGQHQSQFIATQITSYSDTLYYPTVLASIPGTVPEFEIESHVQGSIIQFPSEEASPKNVNQLVWKNNTRVDGSVITFFSMDPGINLKGTLFVKETYFYESPTHYRNWLKDTDITSGSKMVLFPFSMFLQNDPAVIYAN